MPKIKSVFIPTNNDKSFLKAFLDRTLGESFRSICRRAGLNQDWYAQRNFTSKDFREWFRSEVISTQGSRVADIIDVCYNEIVKGKNISPALVKVVLEQLNPAKLNFNLSIKDEEDDEEQTPEQLMIQIVGVLDDHAKSSCRECGAPRIDWDAWRSGYVDQLERGGEAEEGGKTETKEADRGTCGKMDVTHGQEHPQGEMAAACVDKGRD